MSQKQSKQATADDKNKMLKVLPMEEIRKHNKLDDCWIILFGKVYDVSKFMEGHPGGAEVFLENETRDLSESFEEVGHIANFSILGMLKSFLIGKIAESQKPSL